jgi:cytochrome c-type biogenesis protein CcmF
LFIPLMLAVPFGPLMAWKRGDLLGVAQRLLGAAAIALIGIAVTFAVEGGGPILVPFAIGLALYLLAGAATDLIERTGLLKVPARTALARARGLPRSAWGTAFAHAGLAVTLLGIIGETQWGAERIAEVKPGQVISIHRYDFTFDGMTNREGPNYHELAAHFTVRHAGDFVGVMEPSKRSFPSRGSDTSEAALMTRGFAQLYLSLGDVSPDGSIALRLYYKPLVLLIWLGAVVMAFGGALSLSDRRLRVGAPMPARAKTAAMQPAE